MLERGIRPELVLCSSALRARETLERLGPAVEGAEVEIEEELYAAGADTLLGRLRRVGDGVDSVLLVGHNPAAELLVLRLTGSGAGVDRVAEKFPTGALATMELERSWSDLGDGAAVLVDFVVPRELG
jgi:phosphohistidine phosphatase